MKHNLKHIFWGAAALFAVCVAPSAFAVSVVPFGINGFNDPGGFTLNGNSGGYDGQDATAHGVPTISGNTLHLTTTQGVVDGDTFYGSENTSAYYNQQQSIGQFYVSFTYHYNGSNPQSFGPGNGFTFILQNDPRGPYALGTSGYGNGQQGDGGTIMPSAAVEFGLFTGFGQNRGTQLAFNGDPGTNGTFRDTTPVKLVGANANMDDYAPSDPISVTLSYDGTTLSETLLDTVTHAAYNTSYVTNLPAALGSSYAYVGFTGGTGAAVADQTITDFVFSNNVPTAPVNTGPKITVTATASTADPNQGGRRTITVTTTNTGLSGADMLELTSVTLGGANPMAGSPSPIPTTKNLLLAPNTSQQNGFYFAPSSGTTSLPLRVAGQYTDPNTGMTSTFTASIRLSLP
jgi:hypothetical protein